MSTKKARRLTLPSFPPSTAPIQLSGEGEDERLGKGSPLKTLTILSVGPLISQIVQSLYGIVNLFWVSKAIGNIGLEVFGAVYVVDFISLGFADYLMTSLDIRVSYLFGEKSRIDDCSQILVDFIRISFLFGLLLPCLILPICRPLIEWFGSPEEVSKDCLIYLYPTAFGSFFTFLYMTTCGLIQAEGHSFIFGLAQAASLLLNMVCLCPLFLLGFHMGIYGASLATIVSQAIVAITLTVLIFMGKFTVKPQFRMFGRKFSKETWKAMRIGFASLIANYSYSIPELMIQKYLISSAQAIGAYDPIIKVWGVIEKLYQFAGGSNEAFAAGLMPSASYAFGAKRFNRMLRLFMHANWITVVITVGYSIFMILLPRQICLIWSDDEEYLSYCTQMVPVVFYASAFFPIQYTVPAFLQGMQKVTQSTVLAFVASLLPVPIFSSIMYFTGKNDPVRIMWTYVIADTFSGLVCIIFVLPYALKLCKEPKDEIIVGEDALTIRSVQSSHCSSVPLLTDSMDDFPSNQATKII